MNNLITPFLILATLCLTLTEHCLSQTQFLSVSCTGTIGYVSSDHWPDLVPGTFDLELSYEFNPDNPLTDHRGRTVWQGPCDVTLRVGDYPAAQDRSLGVIYVGEDVFDETRQTITFDVSIDSDGPGSEPDRIIVELITEPGQAILAHEEPPHADAINSLPSSVITGRDDGFSIRHDNSAFFEVYGRLADLHASDTDCLADVNGDGMVTPADFTAWINAFNNQLPACDQNTDGACTPADFTAWINNYNAGC